MLARMLGEDQRWSDQLPHLAMLARTFPQDVTPQRDVAQALFNLKEFDQARVALDRALAVDGSDADVLLLHANLLVKEGKREEGLAALKQANDAHEARLKAAGQLPAGKGDAAKARVPAKPAAPKAP
jgi:tetratricopeptide (TPR) repeat protein